MHSLKAALLISIISTRLREPRSPRAIISSVITKLLRQMKYAGTYVVPHLNWDLLEN